MGREALDFTGSLAAQAVDILDRCTQCGRCVEVCPMPEAKRDWHEAQLESAAAAGATTLAEVYHTCHCDLCAHERDWPFEVVNYMELIGEAMDIKRPDIFKRLKMLQDIEAIMADSAERITRYGLDVEEVRDVVLKDVLGELPLPLRGNVEA